MRTLSLLLCAASYAAAPTAAAAQSSEPTAIIGLPSSARHCLSADGSNVHGLGWIDTSTGYSVSFDAGADVTAAFARFDLGENRVTYGFGAPDFSGTAGHAGTVALVVTGNGQPTCYRYKTDVRTGSASIANAGPAIREVSATAGWAREAIASGRAITGSPSSAVHCVSGTAAQVHGLGRVEGGVTIALTFSADFNAAAGVVVLNTATQQRSAWRSVSSGGTEPSLSVTPAHGGELVLYVGSVGNAAGCYRYKLEIR